MALVVRFSFLVVVICSCWCLFVYIWLDYGIFWLGLGLAVLFSCGRSFALLFSCCFVLATLAIHISLCVLLASAVAGFLGRFVFVLLVGVQFGCLVVFVVVFVLSICLCFVVCILCCVFLCDACYVCVLCLSFVCVGWRFRCLLVCLLDL